MTPPRSALGAAPQGDGASRPAQPDLRRPHEDDLRKIRWRCRRGLLENDLFIERFFERHEATLSVEQVDGLLALMELSDNDLLDLFLRRKEPEGALDGGAVRDVLALIRTH
jgi:antitoxin CptB